MQSLNVSSDALGQLRVAFCLLLSRAFSREPDREVLDRLDDIFKGLVEAWELMEVYSDPGAQSGRGLLEEYFCRCAPIYPDEVIE
ncbi:MAG TPA: hypothetical protein VMT71_11040 [Syntrophorhabdales bacterium]|nr:hypothetical protein [Syntrophorhabdales bacterium]